MELAEAAASKQYATSDEAKAWLQGFSDALVGVMAVELDREAEASIDRARREGIEPDEFVLDFNADAFVEDGIRRLARKVLRHLAQIEVAEDDEQSGMNP
jgi:hypothetical protein